MPERKERKATPPLAIEAHENIEEIRSVNPQTEKNQRLIG